MPAPRIDVWVDPICPFCYVAVERAAWLRERYGADVRWHPFDLHPEYQPEGIPREQLDRRYGPAMREQVRTMIAATAMMPTPSRRVVHCTGLSQREST